MDSSPTRETLPPPRDRTPSILSGIVLMSLGVMMFPLLNSCSKLLAGAEFPVLQIVWARFFGHLVVVSIAFLPRRGLRLFVAKQPLLQIGRSFLLLSSTVFFISGIGRVPLATASAIGFMTPLLVTALSVPLLNESVGPRRWAAVIVGFIGALIIIRPGSSLANPAVLLILANTLCYSLYQIATRRTGIVDNAETGIVYAALVGTIVTSAIVPFVFTPTVRLDHLAFFAALGIFGGFGHYLVTRAFQYGPAAVISPFGYVELIGTTALGYLIFGDFPDFWTWIGVAIIVASGVYIAIRERKRARP